MSVLTLQDPILVSNSQPEHYLLCPSLTTLTKQRKKQQQSWALPMLHLLQKRDKGNPQETAGYKPDKVVLTTVFWELICFELAQLRKYMFSRIFLKILSHFLLTFSEFQQSWELHKAPHFRRASQYLGKGWHKKVMKPCIQILELPAPNLSVKLLKNRQGFKITLKPRQQFCNTSERKQEYI